VPSYLWFLDWSDEVSEQISLLSHNERMAVFAKIAALAFAENPYAVDGVEKLAETRFEGQRRIRQGNWRIRFKVELGEIIKQGFTYKGRLVIVAVKDRKDAYK